ncbi:MAG: Flp pilus assembly complex ATPase component TadA [Ruminococcus sp.]|nr:Flp pilus assembly complex ATPase component TadA [Ruminococcus sp.]
MATFNDEERFAQVCGCLSNSLYRRVAPLASKLSKKAMEIRLRINRPLAVVCPDITYYVTKQGGISSTPAIDSLLIVSRADISDTFNNICNHSVYARQNEIINGFVTLNGGHRAGICGTAVMSGGNISNIRDLSSINIRIAREYKGCSAELVKRLGKTSGGLLVCGVPCSGKTTVIRDYARYLSIEQFKNVAVIDERGEIAGMAGGTFQNDIGLCDVYDGYKKYDGMMQAIRSMAPDYIVCDEIGSDSDIKAISHCVNSGVNIIATVHSANEKELMSKVNLVRILQTRAFSKIVFLSNKNSVGEISKIVEVGELIGH